MTPTRGAPSLSFATLVALLLLAACGAPRAGPRPPALREPIAAPRPSLVDRVQLACRDRSACTDGVGLLLRPTGDDAQRCTAVLVASDRVLTAAHCLAPTSRRAGARCGDTWIGFAAQPMEWVACERVLAADHVEDSSVMRRDVALLRLERRVARRTHPIDPRPLDEGSIVTVVAVRPQPIYPLYHELDERLCRVATRQSAVETFGSDAGRVGWLMDCPSYPGNSGAPVLDARGRVRSLLHAGSDRVSAVGVTSALHVR